MRRWEPVLNVIFVLGLPLLYVLIADRINLLAALILFVLKWRLSGRLLPATVSAALLPLAIHAFFGKLLPVPFPWACFHPPRGKEILPRMTCSRPLR